ncbi:AAA family ATPase [Dactylosporangium sucinum]|uniref:LuxR family transcriptional regulator n=1 Tax=Dactylosporangium sucinum TaxID=1424081 RepID=A0A917WHE6_9ACTN|nr:LuxR family transcriptional regulator [Dactylosporangium sucinum]GGM04194.1 LuxR family transcriptional regulator [Dactylosporangium sucinum]
MLPDRHAAPLVGREPELAVLGARVAGIRDGGGAVVVRGEAGIGKSALLAEAERRAAAAGARVLRATAVESETQITYSGLYQLVSPVLAHADGLPAPQRAAVLAALGRTEAAAPDLFLVALATLNLLAEAATHAPLLLVVDDAHWLDRASADVLVFVARRLEFEPMGLLVAVREGVRSVFDGAGLPELAVGRLDDDAAAALLDAGAPALRQAVRERVLAESAGSPLALVELPIAMRDVGDGVAPIGPLPLTRRLEDAFAARVSALPAATRQLLLVAALSDGEVLSEVLAAAALLGGEAPTVEAFGPAVQARLLEVEGARVSFRHPLMRSAVVQRAGIGPRRQVHAAFAALLTDDADRRVWHRSAAMTGPDEELAAELEAAAGRARRRGGVEAAVAALRRAAEVSADPQRRGERLLRAAELAFELGRPDLVSGLLDTGAAAELTPRQRTRMAWIRGRFDDGVGDVPAGARSLTDLAERAAADGDAGLALKLLWGAALRCFWTEPGAAMRDEVVRVAEGLPVDAHDGRRLAVLAFAAPIESGAVVVDHLRFLATHPSRHGRAARRAEAALLVGAFDLAVGFSATAIAQLRAEGRLGLLARCLATQAWGAAHLGDLAVAIPAAEEAARLSRETAQPIMYATARVTQALLAALRGDWDQGEALSAEAERAALRVAARPVLATVCHARGLAALADGRPAEAYEHLSRMYDPADPAYHPALRCFAVADLVEAAVRGGHRGPVADVVAQLEDVARVTPSPALHAGLRYARALLAADADAEALFEDALRADLVRWPFARARVQLAYGGWLRRQRRAADSRGRLRAAGETFDALGTIPWSDRARQELRASGETIRRRIPAAREQLTPQELQIAQMAADGLTNREIGERLYLSHRTISSHLHRIFPKLGISSRAALRTALHPQAA